jgi:hypothetical protein
VIGMPEGIRKLCMAYDVEGYSGRGTRHEFAVQARLDELLTYAFREAGLPEGAEEVQEQGDGGIAFLPTGGTLDEPRILVGLMNALRVGLTELNEDMIDRARIRLRVGLHEGVVHRASHGYVGPAVIEVCRLRDADVTRVALARVSDPLVVVVADRLYQDVLSHGYHGLPASMFTRADIQAKSFAAVGWIYLPTTAQAPRQALDSIPPPEIGAGPQSPIDGYLSVPPDTW